MIHSFSFENFYSFKDKQEISFVVDKNAPDNDGYFIAPSGTRLSKINLVIGANASGKSNAMIVLPFVRLLVLNDTNRRSVPFQQFKFQPEGTKTTKLSVVFELGADKDSARIYTYNIELSKERILKEELKATRNNVVRRSTSTLFLRQWEDGSYQLKVNDFGIPPNIFRRPYGEHRTIISTGDATESGNILDFWYNLNVAVQDPIYTRGIHELHKSIEAYFEKPKIRKEAEKYLRRFDTGLSGLKIQQRIDDLYAQGVHTIDNKEYSIPLHNESSGTRQMLIVLAHILFPQITTPLGGSIVNVFDEIDVNLHPGITEELLDLFIYPKTKAPYVQTLITTHNHLLLNEVNKQQITIVEKNKKGVSKISRMDRIRGARHDDNFFAKYTAGAYGGLPNKSYA